MNNLIYEGEGVNRKTGKSIKFKVSEAISNRGLELIRKNIFVFQFKSYKPEMLFGDDVSCYPRSLQADTVFGHCVACELFRRIKGKEIREATIAEIVDFMHGGKIPKKPPNGRWVDNVLLESGGPYEERLRFLQELGSSDERRRFAIGIEEGMREAEIEHTIENFHEFSKKKN